MNPVRFEHCIGVRLLIPVGGLHRLVSATMPDGNHIGSLILGKLVKAELALDGVEADVQLAGPFNQMMGFVWVDDLDKGLLVFSRVLSDLGFTDHLIEIGHFDFQECIWRLHPYGDATAFNEAFGPRGFGNLREKIGEWTKIIKQDTAQ